ncbi:hypothetical protein C0J52_14236, partial [Blattella germanica]
HIDEIGFRSSFFSSEVTKLLAVVVRDVRINKDVGGADGKRDHKTEKVESQKFSSGIDNAKPINFHDTKVPPMIITFAQFMAVHIYNVNTMLLRAESPEFLVHATAGEVHLDGSIVHNSRTLLVNVTINSATTKILRHAERKDDSAQTCLGELSFGISMEATLIAQGPLSVEKLYVGMNHTKAVISEGFYNFAQERRQIKEIEKSPRTQYTHSEESDIFQRLSPVIPKLILSDMIICVFTGDILPHISLAVQVDELNVKCNRETVLLLRKLAIDSKEFEPVLNKADDIKQDMAYSGNWLETLARRCQVKGFMDFWAVSALIKLSDDACASVGFSHTNTKFVLDQFSEKQDTGTKLEFMRLLLGECKWSTELLVESLWCRLGSSAMIADAHLLKKYHTWSTPLFLGVFLVKLRNPGLNQTKFNAMLDTLRFEWSPPFAHFIIQGLRCILEYKEAIRNSWWASQPNIKNVGQNGCNQEVDVQKYFESCILNITLTNVDAFFIGEKKGKFQFRIMPHTNLCNTHNKSAVGHVKLARLNYKRKSCDLNVQLLEEVQAHWSANLHLKLLTLVEEIDTFKSTVKDDIVWSMNNENFGIQAMSIKIAIDNKDIFTIEGFHISKLLDSEEVRIERKNTEEFILPWNRTWSVTINSLKACFPYEHNFAEAVQNEFISVFKWLKLMHKKQKTPFTSDSPLPSDLVIKVQIQMESRKDNYELLEDEYKESLKRQKMLDAKVAELCKAHLLLPSGKVEELYASLSKRNTEIYVQRSKQMCRAAPARTRLFAWLMNDVEIMSLADPSIHGAENVVKNMTEIDPESPWPEDGLEFTTLWCRSVCASCKEWKFQLRDFPQPLLDIREFHIWGRLVGAEQVATRRGKDSNACFEKILTPSRDPSPPLPFWDKMRLLFHGRLTMCIRQMTVLLHASLDPYNTTEEMELTWSDVAMDWTNDKLPEYSSNQTKPVTNRSPAEFDCPIALLYGSTLRWFENLKLILSGVTRPTRRGAVFRNFRPRKIQLSRHYRKVHLLLVLHRFQVYYWMSFAMQRGFELLGGRISSCSEWSIMYMNCELDDAEIWLKSALQEEPGKEQLKKNLSTEALKGFRGESSSTPLKSRTRAPEGPVTPPPPTSTIQVLLKGCETKGYVILSAAKAEILQRIHRPVWKDRTLVSKTTWVGSLECMQYYATVSAGENDSLDGK